MPGEEEIIVGMETIPRGFSWKVGRASGAVPGGIQRVVMLSIIATDGTWTNIPFNIDQARHLAARVIEEADKSDAAAEGLIDPGEQD